MTSTICNGHCTINCSSFFEFMILFVGKSTDLLVIHDGLLRLIIFQLNLFSNSTLIYICSIAYKLNFYKFRCAIVFLVEVFFKILCLRYRLYNDVDSNIDVIFFFVFFFLFLYSTRVKNIL